MVEIGLLHGGSAIYWEQRFCPERLDLFDITPSIPALEDYMMRHQLDHVHLHLGISQDDRAAITSILDAPIDAVIDDASHQYAETLASFEAIFPLIRPGGVYIIEDWAWGHAAGWRGWDERPLLSPLIMQLVLMAADERQPIFHVDVTGAFAVIERGYGTLDQNFRVKDYYNPRGLDI
jgi:hypothetical protein